MTVFIYGLYDPRKGVLRYVGKTIKPKVRLLLHLCEKRNTHKNNWIRMLLSEGVKPEMRILETIENSNDLDWQERERWWIKSSLDARHALTNLDSGGRSGKLLGAETKRKISESHKGKKHSEETCAKISKNRSAATTQETREKLRISATGRKHSEETRRKRTASLLGRECSAETRLKIASAQIGKFVSEETRSKIRAARAHQVITPETRLKLSLAAKGRPPSPQTIAASVARSKGVPFTEAHRAMLVAAKRRNRQACVLFGLRMDNPDMVKAALFIAAKVP